MEGQGYVLVYDRAVLPKGLTLEQVFGLMRVTGVLQYDSSLLDKNVPENYEPIKLMFLGGDESKNSHLKDVKFVDISKA